MVVKRVKRLCSVKGCKSTDSFAISQSSEYGGVIICRKCLEDALWAAKRADEAGTAKAATDRPELRRTAPIFFHPEKEADRGKAASRGAKAGGGQNRTRPDSGGQGRTETDGGGR